ncbi:hypothetical protein VP01_40g2 [Puccinia sorghi]|uniref:Uncharacterized protein n=1 Tax=Puccinia sorghi TaxID=27349 RepID=A0A0L6URA2_9BASI|nr:hypothetical protein VP01_40g2 [Puccinia sorghi]
MLCYQDVNFPNLKSLFLIYTCTPIVSCTRSQTQDKAFTIRATLDELLLVQMEYHASHWGWRLILVSVTPAPSLRSSTTYAEAGVGMLGRNLVLDLQPHSLGLNVTLKGTLIGATGQDSPWLVCAATDVDAICETQPHPPRSDSFLNGHTRNNDTAFIRKSRSMMSTMREQWHSMLRILYLMPFFSGLSARPLISKAVDLHPAAYVDRFDNRAANQDFLLLSMTPYRHILITASLHPRSHSITTHFLRQVSVSSFMTSYVHFNHLMMTSPFHCSPFTVDKTHPQPTRQAKLFLKYLIPTAGPAVGIRTYLQLILLLVGGFFAHPTFPLGVKVIGLTLTKISIPKPPTLGRQQIRKIVIPFDPQRLVAAANTFFLTRSAPLLKQEKSTAACTELYTDIIHTLRYILSTSRVPIRIIQAPPILVNQALSPKVNESFAHDVLAGASETDHLSTIFLIPERPWLSNKESDYKYLFSQFATKKPEWGPDVSPKIFIEGQLDDFKKTLDGRIKNANMHWANLPWVLLQPTKTARSSKINVVDKSGASFNFIPNLESSYLELVTYLTQYNMALISKVSKEDRQLAGLDATKDTEKLASWLKLNTFRSADNNFIKEGLGGGAAASPETANREALLKHLHHYFSSRGEILSNSGETRILSSRMAKELIEYWHSYSPTHWKLIAGSAESNANFLDKMLNDKQVNAEAVQILAQIKPQTFHIDNANQISH